tara:strand:+ start:3272 stop:4258 length:987 start_codon:yes stop_codon:yes gene_type:complete
MIFSRKKQLLPRLLIGDGLGRAGKSLLCHVLTGFENVEKMQYYNFLEHLTLAHYHKKISDDMVVTLLKTQMDVSVFDQMNGRNINTRPDDYSGLDNYHSPELYIERQNRENHSEPNYVGNPNATSIIDKIIKEKPIFLTFAHDLISRSEMIFEAFDKKVSFVYLNRLPIDLIHEWYIKGFGERIGTDATEMQFTISHDEETVPEYCYGWEQEYLDISPLERIVKIIYTCFKRNYKGLHKHRNKKQFIIVDFESLVTKPKDEINKISTFLNLKPLNVIEDILQKNACPRKLDKKEFLRRDAYIKDQISLKYQKLLEDTNFLHKEISKLS